MNYFENIYLGKKSENKALQTSKKLQRLLGSKALNSSSDSKKLTAGDFKKMQPTAMKTCKIAEIDFDNYIRPYEII
jgi:hypothetical protein